jgi:hypothetical protein
VTERCSAGHRSAARDSCDVCGERLDPEPPVSNTTTVTKVTRCPHCNGLLQPGDRFCEACGRDVTALPSVARWRAEVAADPAFHSFLDPDGIDFPDDPRPPVLVELDAAEIVIGRHPAPDAPEPFIDLGIEPTDASVSRRHACLRRQPDGSYAVVAAGVSVALEAGDRIHVGAWTTITIVRVDD